MNQVAGVIVRVVVVLTAAFAVWKSSRIARADLAWSDGTSAGLARAALILPDDADIAARKVLRRVEDGDDSPDLDHELEQASGLNPLNSELLMTRGLRAELHGDPALAEKFLVQAAAVDHQFKPAWTLANFALRSGRMAGFRPMLKRCLELDPLGFEPYAIFDLAWRASDDAVAFQSLFPPRSPKAVSYLSYLSGSGRTEAALADWPAALEAVNSSSQPELAVLRAFPGFLVTQNRTDAALRAWNQLVDRGIQRAGKLDPSQGSLLSDPEFSFERNAGLFSWQVTAAEGIFPAPDFSSLRIELDGNQREPVMLLATSAAALPGASHRLTWLADGSRLNLTSDPGFVFRIIRQNGERLAECPPLLENHGNGGCAFTAGPKDTTLRLELWYSRATGTTRATGTIQLSQAKLAAAR